MGLQKFNCDFKKTLDPLCDSSLCANQSSLLLLHVVSEFSKASFLSCLLSKLPYTFDLLEIRTGPTNQRTLCFHLNFQVAVARESRGSRITCKIFHLKIVVVLPEKIWTIFILFFTIQFAVHTTQQIHSVQCMHMYVHYSEFDQNPKIDVRCPLSHHQHYVELGAQQSINIKTGSS